MTQLRSQNETSGVPHFRSGMNGSAASPSKVSGIAKLAAVAVLAAASGAGLTYSFVKTSSGNVAPQVVSNQADMKSAGPVVGARSEAVGGAERGEKPTAEPSVQAVESKVTPVAAVDVEPDVKPLPPEPREAAEPTENASPTEKTKSQKPSQPALGGRLNINRANAAELELLPNIGPKLAQAIIAFREANGPFRSIVELDQVKGIGAKTLEKLAPMISVDDAR